MYKVLIVDDEDIICRGLASLISRRTELQVVALAEDGEIALKKAMETLPDLMLVDINMPFLNGLEFVETIHDVLPDVVIIIVTGYDDFEFVQKALQLGVTDYVLKPVMEKSFFEVLDKAVSKLDRRDDSKSYINWMEEQMEQNRSKMVNDFLDNWIRNQMGSDEIERQMGYLKIRIPVPYRIGVIHIYRDYERESFQNNGNLSEELSYVECSSIVQRCFEPYSEVICFQTEEGALAVVSKVLPQQQWERLEQKLVLTFDESLCAKVEMVWKRGDSIPEFPGIFQQVISLYKERVHYSDIVLQTIDIIGMQWGDSNLSLLSVADSLFVSAPYLSKVFRRETGENFAAYLTRKRINEAKSLLKNTNMKMYEIAQKTGYTSQHYFSNAFKKNMGISPADYRKNFQK